VHVGAPWTRRQFLAGMTLAAVGVACGGKKAPLGSFPTTPPGSFPTPGPPINLPSGHCVLGSTPGVQATLGLAGRQYVAWDSDIFDPADQKAFLRPDTQFLNIKFAPRVGWAKGQNALWEEIASGAEDARIDSWAVALNKVPRILAIALHHEPIPGHGPPPNCGQEGCASDLVASVTRVVTKWKVAGVKHILCQVLIGPVFMNNLQDEQLAIDSLDAVGVDGYGQDNAQKTFLDAPTVFDAALGYAKAHGKPLVIFETSFQNPGPGQDVVYFESLDAYLKANVEIIGCALWLGFTPLNNDALNSEGLGVVTGMAQDPYYGRTFGA
jgi:hypothetical protein